MELLYDRKNAWEKHDKSHVSQANKFCDEYIKFLNGAKTEREFTKRVVEVARERGFVSYEDVLKNDTPLVKGVKVYRVIKNKAVILCAIGEESLTEGINIIGSHIDAPRLDLKQNPLYEDTELGMLDTHYYGGIKKYQWTTIPLSLHGVVVKKDGTSVDICIGENDKDPVFTITDLLPHLAQDQMQKKMSEGVTGEDLNVLCGSIPCIGKDAPKKDKVKTNIMKLINKKYGFKEEDFISAEIEVVPSFKARSVGFDESLVGSYGQDDRSCAYAALSAILDVLNPKKTCVCLLTDKEEIGSVGNTGAYATFFETFVEFLLKYVESSEKSLDVRRCLENSRMLSADVNPGVDPNYTGVQENKNASYLGKGVVIQKYTGSRGKVGGSDANAEYLGYIRKIFDDNNIIWQSAELGKVDQGGGGTIAYMLAKYGIEVLDCGVAILSMHSPFEITSKIDMYEMYRASKVFFEN